MKRIFWVFALLSAISPFRAQTLDDIGRMSIGVQSPVNSGIPQEALDILEDRMHQIITSNGIADNDFNRRFVIASTVSTIKKDIISGSPARVSQTIEVSFFIKDIIDHKEFSSVSITSVGIGLHENKAYIMAYNNIKAGNPKIQKMIDSAKEQIVAYYRTNIEKIVKDANNLAEKGEYNKALYLLAQVPDVCLECTEQCRSASLAIYQKKIDSEGLILLQQAQSIWAGFPNANGAAEASRKLMDINILASCQSNVVVLMDEMKEKVKDDEKRIWEFELQKYADQKAREQRDFELNVQKYQDKINKEQRDHDFAVRQFEANHARDMAIIEACREVALEEVKHNQQ